MTDEAGRDRRASGPYEVRVEENVAARMRDGTVLRADVVRPVPRPGEPDSFPVLLMRLPYGKRPWPDLARHGYVVVVQDMRGRYASDGEYDPVCQPGGALVDRDDGYDTVLWASRLPGADGRVGVAGMSYGAWAAWELAIARPPPLVALYVSGMAVRSTSVEPLPRPGRRLQWFFQAGAPDARRRADLPGPHTHAEARRLWETERHKWLWFLPWSDLPDAALAPLTPYLKSFWRSSTRDHFRFDGQHGEIDVPVFHHTGWYDRWVHTIDHFTAMRAHGRTPRARENQRLVVGPWSHTWALPRKVGDVDFGSEAGADHHALMLRWFDHWLKGRDTGVITDQPVRYFVMGRNAWRGADAWPPPGRSVRWYLRSGGHANTAAGDGVLSSEPPDAGEAAEDRFTYDPRDPVPTLWPLDDQAAPLDHRAIDHRPDLLVYASEPLVEPLEIAGAPVVELWAASSARDTDFVARLADVRPDGFVHPLCSGLVRARHRDGYGAPPRLLEPGRVEQYRVTLDPTAHCFLPGHRVRLEVTSSDFPNWDRNHNTGGDDLSEATLVAAHQTIVHTAQQPTAILLPVSAHDARPA